MQIRRLPFHARRARRYHIDHRVQAASGGGQIVLRPDTLPRGFGKGGTPGAVDDQAAHRLGKGRRVARWDEKAGYFRHDDFADTAAAPATTGTPLACASSSAMPKASLSAGHTHRSAEANRLAISIGPISPAQVTRSLSGESASSTSHLAGPSPTTSNDHGRSSRCERASPRIW